MEWVSFHHTWLFCFKSFTFSSKANDPFKHLVELLQARPSTLTLSWWKQSTNASDCTSPSSSPAHLETLTTERTHQPWNEVGAQLSIPTNCNENQGWEMQSYQEKVEKVSIWHKQHVLAWKVFRDLWTFIRILFVNAAIMQYSTGDDRSHCDFNVHFYDYWWSWASLHTSLCHSEFLFLELPVRVICPFSTGCFMFLNWFVGILYLFWILILC